MLEVIGNWQDNLFGKIVFAAADRSPMSRAGQRLASVDDGSHGHTE